MQIRNALLVGILSLCGLVLPASGARINTRDRPAREAPSSHVIHERHEEGHVDGWTKRELADASWVLPMRIGLKQSNVDAGHELLMNMLVKALAINTMRT
jgi:tripeptidyl-peptidase-1